MKHIIINQALRLPSWELVHSTKPPSLQLLLPVSPLEEDAAAQRIALFPKKDDCGLAKSLALYLLSVVGALEVLGAHGQVLIPSLCSTVAESGFGLGIRL